MGVVIANNEKSVKMGYFTFGIIRMGVADSFSQDVGRIYKKMYNGISLCKEDYNYLDKQLPKYLDKFLWHSDCDGYFCKRDVKGIYNELIKLNPIFQNNDVELKYKAMLDVFSQGERIDLW